MAVPLGGTEGWMSVSLGGTDFVIFIPVHIITERGI